jgi:probable rRNA maturation factor
LILSLVDRRSAPGDDPTWKDGGELALGAAALAARVGPSVWAVDLVLVDDAVMEQINRDYRGVAGVTDVLSFSYLLATGTGPPALAAGRDHAHCDLWLDAAEARVEGDGAPVVGEIVLAPAFVADRCRDKGWPAAVEFALLVVHGCLHILGWEHERTADSEAMRATEAGILGQFDLPHPLR